MTRQCRGAQARPSKNCLSSPAWLQLFRRPDRVYKRTPAPARLVTDDEAGVVALVEHHDGGKRWPAGMAAIWAGRPQGHQRHGGYGPNARKTTPFAGSRRPEPTFLRQIGVWRSDFAQMPQNGFFASEGPEEGGRPAQPRHAASGTSGELTMCVSQDTFIPDFGGCVTAALRALRLGASLWISCGKRCSSLLTDWKFGWHGDVGCTGECWGKKYCRRFSCCCPQLLR